MAARSASAEPQPGRGPVAVVPVRDAQLPQGGAEAVAEAFDAPRSAARAVVVGSGTAEAASGLAGLAGRVEVAEVGDFAPGAWARSLASELRHAAFVVVPGSPDGRDLAARIAAELGWPLLSNALSATATEVVVAHHGGRLQSVVHPAEPFVATLQPGVRTATVDGSATVEVVELDLPVEAGVLDATVVGIEGPDVATMDLAEAPRIVGGGAGLLGDDAAARFDQLTRVGTAIGASMGATRVVTDAGFVHHDRQIGTTGVVVDPRLYLAFGISGAVQHTAGLGHPDHVVSVNTDPHCPMMAMADLAVVGDARAVLDALEARLADGPDRERA